MIYSVSGELIHVEPSLAVVECGGVGYACRTTNATLSALGPVGRDVRLYTHLNVREDCVELFGFATLQERNCFITLTSVSGVGPKVGLAILSDITPERFALCIATGDFKAFTRCKGVGPKLAQRIVLELKDKITNDDLTSGLASGAADYAPPDSGSAAGEAIAALVVLGYSQSEAAQCVAKLDSSLSVEEMIKLSLRQMGTRL